MRLFANGSGVSLCSVKEFKNYGISNIDLYSTQPFSKLVSMEITRR